MGDKSLPNRFSLQFNARDSKHQQVIKILNMQGRKKAQYIVEAILNYDSQEVNDTDFSQNSELAHNKIAAIVEQILASKSLAKSSTNTIKNNDILPNQRKIIKTETQTISENEYNLSDDDFDLISGMIDNLKSE